MARIYPWNKAIIRIYRKLRGDTIDPDIMELGLPEVTLDEALSGIAEILQGSGTETLNLPGVSFGGTTGIDGDFVVSGTLYAEDMVARDDHFVGDDLNVTGTVTSELSITHGDASIGGDLIVSGSVSVGGALNVTGTATVEDLIAQDAISGDNALIGTGTFYAGSSRVSVGGYSLASLFGDGSIVLGIGPASVRPSGSLAHLGGVLFAEGGSLLWLGSSGTVSTVAGS